MLHQRLAPKKEKRQDMAKEDLKLYGMKLSPFVLRVEWALKLKGIDYEYIHEDLKNKSMRLHEHNPVYKMVPVLVHNSKAICESTVILEYIEEMWKDRCPSILPSDPHQKAVARFLSKFSEEKCLHGSFDILSKTGEEQLKAIKEFQASLKILEDRLQDNKFFNGENIGMVDIVAGWIPIWLGIIEEVIGYEILDEQELPSFKAWMDNVLDLDIVKESMPPLDKTKSHLKNIRESVLSAQLSP